MKELEFKIDRDPGGDIFLVVRNDDMDLVFEVTAEQFKKLNADISHIFEDLMIEQRLGSTLTPEDYM